jgi:probable HAF family extracellular repeat protein
MLFVCARSSVSILVLAVCALGSAQQQILDIPGRNIEVTGMSHSGAYSGWAESNGGGIDGFILTGTIGSFSVNYLPTLGGTITRALGISNSNVAPTHPFVVGESRDGLGRIRPFAYQNGVMVDLGTLGGSSGGALAASYSGRFAGWSETTDGRKIATLWRLGNVASLGSLGGDESCATGINTMGYICGWSKNAQGRRRAFLWFQNSMRDLGSLGGSESIAQGMNPNGDVVGVADEPNGRQFAVIWKRSTDFAIEKVGKSTATFASINSSGSMSYVGGKVATFFGSTWKLEYRARNVFFPVAEVGLSPLPVFGTIEVPGNRTQVALMTEEFPPNSRGIGSISNSDTNVVVPKTVYVQLKLNAIGIDDVLVPSVSRPDLASVPASIPLYFGQTEVTIPVSIFNVNTIEPIYVSASLGLESYLVPEPIVVGTDF